MRELIDLVENGLRVPGAGGRKPTRTQRDPLTVMADVIIPFLDFDIPSPRLREASALLKQSGYEEPVRGPNAYVVSSYDVTDEDKARYRTLGELFAVIQQNPPAHRAVERAWDTLDGAITDCNVSAYHGDSPSQRDEASLARFGDITYICHVRLSPGGLLLSDPGIQRFLDKHPCEFEANYREALRSIDTDGHGRNYHMLAVDTDRVSLVRCILYEQND